MNYKGIPITIEYKKGDWKPDKDSPAPNMGWPMYADYGYIEETVSMEPGDALDVFVGEDEDNDEVYWIEMLDKEHNVFEEYKLCLGFESPTQAYDLLCMQYGADRIGPLFVTSIEDLKEVIQEGKLSYQKGLSLPYEGESEEPPEESLVVEVEREIQETDTEGSSLLKSVQDSQGLELVVLL